MGLSRRVSGSADGTDLLARLAAINSGSAGQDYEAYELEAQPYGQEQIALCVMRVARGSHRQVHQLIISRDAGLVSMEALLHEASPAIEELKVWAQHRQQLAEQNRRDILARKAIRAWLDAAISGLTDSRGRHLSALYEFWPGPTRERSEEDPDVPEDSNLRARAFAALIPSGYARHWGVVSIDAPDNPQWGDDCLRVLPGGQGDMNRLSKRQERLLLKEGALERCKKRHPYYETVQPADGCGAYGPTYPSVPAYEKVQLFVPGSGSKRSEAEHTLTLEGGLSAEQSAQQIISFVSGLREAAQAWHDAAELARAEQQMQRELYQSSSRENQVNMDGDLAAIRAAMKS